MTRAVAIVATLALTASAGVRAHVPACDSAKSELTAVSRALKFYAGTHDGTLPSRVDWIAPLKRDGLIEQQWTALDPWGRPYVYWPKGNDDFELRTIGADGVFGTRDDQRKEKDWAWATCRDPVFPRGCSL